VSRRSHRDVVFVERESSSPLWWLVVGGALGAGLALLFAPDAGSKTRRILARRLSRLRSSAEGVIGEFREAVTSDDAEEGDEETENEDGETEAEVDDEDEDAEEAEKEKVPSARAELEKRLALARARRQRELVDEDEEPVA